MRELLALLVVISLFSLDRAVIYQPVSPQPCNLADNGFTDLVLNCSSQIITIKDAGKITGIRVGATVEHGNTENLLIMLVTPNVAESTSIIFVALSTSRKWIGRSTGEYSDQIMTDNTVAVYYGNDKAPILLFDNGGAGSLGYPNLGAPSTGQFFNMTAVADPVYGFEAVYWMDEWNAENITGNFGQLRNNDDQVFKNLVGEEITGDWSLVIADRQTNDTGRLIKWVLDIQYCGDGEVTYPEECDSGSGCNNCTCFSGYRPDPNNPGSCAVNSCGDGSVGEEEECDGGYGCDKQCICRPGWTPNVRRTSHCQLIGKQFTQTSNTPLPEGAFEQVGVIDITESGIIQSVKFGVLIEHAYPIDIYIWVVRTGSAFPVPLPADSADEAGLVVIDKDPAAIKLLGYYGSYLGATDVGNVQTGNQMFVGSANDKMFSAPRLNPAFATVEGDVSAAERPQSNKIASLIGTQLRGAWKLVGGDWNANEINGTVLQFTIEVLYCGDAIFNPWYEQCDSVAQCNNRTCTCLDGFAPKDGSCVLCGNGQVDPGEECDSTANCSDTCKCLSGTSNGTYCVVVAVSSPPPSTTDQAALIGGLVGGLVGGALVAGAVVLIVLAAKGKLKKKKKKVEKQKLNNNDVETGSGPGSVYTPLGINNESELGSNSKSTEMQSLAAEDRMKIPWASLVFKQEIGMGGFGKVFIGEWQRTKIAIKMATIASAEDFLKEVKLSVMLRPHPNVVQTLGVSVDGQFPALVLEYCAGGSLDKALQNKAKDMSYLDKLRIVTGISKGMLHLHSNNIVHRDLAARNVLLSATGEPKISDFGMSRQVGDDLGNTTRTTVGPIKWMAPESVKSWQYSKKSDVWSFGVVVWEVVTREEPYKDEDLMELALSIRDDGRTLEIPNCEPVFQSIMRDCFQHDPANRKDFDLICAELDQELEAQEAINSGHSISQQTNKTGHNFYQ